MLLASAKELDEVIGSIVRTWTDCLDRDTLTMIAVLKGDGAVLIPRLQIREILVSEIANGFLQVCNKGFTRHDLFGLPGSAGSEYVEEQLMPRNQMQ